MAINNSKLLSGRVPVTPYSNLTNDRYQFLGLDQAEPSLGAGDNNSVLTISTSNNRVWSNALTLSSLTVNGESNLGDVGNVKITGGSNGQVITTDGLGNLTFTSASGVSNLAAPMPYFIPTGEAYTVSNNFQGLFSIPITIDGELEVDGVLVEVEGGGGGGGNSLPGGSNTQIQYNDTGVFGGNSAFTFNEITGVVTTPNLAINGQVSLTGNIIPTSNVAYDLGNNTNRFNDLYLSGTTINLGNATLSANSTAVIITNPAGGSFVMGGNVNTSTSLLANGNSNITIANNSSIGISVNGVSNVALITRNGLDVTGTIGATGDITTLGNMSSLGSLSVVDIAASGNLNVTGNVSMGNANITGSFAASGNLSGVNINTSGDLGVIGNANIQTNLYVGTNAIVNTRLTVGNPNGQNRSDFFTNGYGSLSNLAVSGNVSANNISISSNLSVTGRASIGTLQTSGVNALGNITAANIVSNGAINASGNLTVLNANLGNLAIANFFEGDGRFLTNITVAGGTSLVNGNSNVFVEPNANVIFSVNGSANRVIVTDSNTYFNTNIVSNANILANVIKTGNVSMTLNGTGTWIAFDIGSGNVLELHDDWVGITGNANISNVLRVTGNTVLGNVSASFASITNANVVGINASGNISAGNVNGGNLVTANFLQGDGYLISNLTIAAGSSIINGNSNVQVAANANVTITAEGNANVVTVTGNSVVLNKQLLGTNANFAVANITTLNSTTLSVQNALTVNADITANGAITGETLLIRKVAGLAGTASIEGNLFAQSNLFVSGYSNVQHINAASIQVAGSINANNNISADDTMSANAVTSVFTLSTSGNLSVTGNTTLNNRTNVNANLNVSSNITAGNIDGGNLVSANFFSGDGYLLSNLTIPAGTALLNGTSNLFVDGSGNVRTSVAGTANVWVVRNNGANLVGTLNVSGNANVGNIGAGVGLFTGNVTGANANFSGGLVVSGSANIAGNINSNSSISANGNITSLNANLGNLVSANFFTGDGYLLTNLTIPAGTAIINGGSNVLVTANSNVNITVNGTPNVLQVAEYGVIVNGNIRSTGEIVGASFANGSSNIAITNNGAVDISANGVDALLSIRSTGIFANTRISGTQGLGVTGNSNIANLGLTGFITTPGQISAGNLTSSGDLTVAANANIANARISGTLNTIGNITGGNIVTGGTANVAALFVGANGANINGYTKINANLDVTGNINVTGNLNYSNVTDLVVGDPLIFIGANNPGDTYDLGIVASYTVGTLKHTGIARNEVDGVWTFFDNVAAQPTTVVDWANASYPTVKLGNLVSTGNATFTGNVSANFFNGNVVGNISGNITVGSNTQVLFSDGGTIAGNNGFTFNKTTSAITVTGNVSGGNITTAGIISATGNLTAGNANLGNLTSANYGAFGGQISGQTFNLVARSTDNTIGPFAVQATATNNYSIVAFFNSSNVLSGSVGYANPSTTFYPNQMYMWGSNGIAFSGNGFSATGGTRNMFINSSGIVTIPTGVAATSTTTGAFVVTGGVGVSGNIYANNANITGTMNVTGNSTLSPTLILQGTSNTTAFNQALTVRANNGNNSSVMGIMNEVANGYSSLLFFNNSGVEMGAVAFANPNALYFANSTYLYGSGSGGLILSANIGSAPGNRNLWITNAGLVTIPGSTAASNTTTGAFQVTGGVGVGGDIYAGGIISATGNITAGNINAGNLLTANFIAGTLTTAAQGNITSLGVLSSLTATGNISAGNLIGILANGNSNVRIPSANGNVAISSAGNANIVVITGTGANITGTANVTGNLSVGGRSNLGPVSNVTITGGNANFVLRTDGAGNLSWVAQSGGGGGSANIAVYDDGNLLTSTVSSLDFVGAGVTATNTGNAVTVTITGGGGGQAAISSDTFTGNGVQTAFVLSTAPDSIDSTFVNIDGVSQLRNAYSLSGSTLTFTSAPMAGAEIEVTIIQSVVSGYSNLTTRNYTGNGVQNTFTVTSGVTASSLLVTENGILQTPDSDYTVSGANLTFTSAPANAQAIQIRELQTVIPEPVGEGLVYSRSSMIATAGQTSFAVAYSVGYLQVYLNGVLLNTSDYVATTGATIVLDEAAAAGDLLEIITYNLIPFNQVQVATLNSTNLTSNMVITAGYSAMSVGPLSVADGVTISIAAGQKWVIL
jgi:filamentous hemagglutinin